MSSKVGLLVCGAAGKMGSRVCALAKSDARLALRGQLFRETPPSERDFLLKNCEVVVDFSAPSSALELARACASARKAIVIGTTGLSEAQSRGLARLAKKIPIFFAPNFSPAVALLCGLARIAAAGLPGYDAAIFEVHHRAKKDAPSGTALRLAEAVKMGNGKRPAIASERVGAVVGEHTITLAGPFERLELTHRAQSRDLFAQGALDAAAWIVRRKPGLYGMDDMLGLR